MSDVRWIRFKDVRSSQGTLTSVEPSSLPFDVAHVFFTRELPVNAVRGNHAHYYLEEVIVAVSGAFIVSTYDDRGWRHWHLNDPSSGLYLPPKCWRRIGNFSSNAVALVLASDEYNEADYIRDMGAFESMLPPLEEDYFTRRGKAGSFDAFVRMPK